MGLDKRSPRGTSGVAECRSRTYLHETGYIATGVQAPPTLSVKVKIAKRGNAVTPPLCNAGASRPQGRPMEARHGEVGRSEGRPVIGRIESRMDSTQNAAATAVARTGSRRPTGVSLREHLENHRRWESK